MGEDSSEQVAFKLKCEPVKSELEGRRGRREPSKQRKQQVQSLEEGNSLAGSTRN